VASGSRAPPRWSCVRPLSGLEVDVVARARSRGRESRARSGVRPRGRYRPSGPPGADRNGDRNPRNDVEVITLHVGGNDVTGPIIAACLGGLTAGCVATIQAELTAYRADLERLLSALRSAAGSDTAIVIGTYDNPIATCTLGAVPGAVQLGALTLEGGGPIPDGLHDVMRQVAAEHDVLVASVYGELVPADWVGGNDCLHPRDSGYAKVVAAFLETLGA
jgi:lysophospholipase L1-like esterase